MLILKKGGAMQFIPNITTIDDVVAEIEDNLNLQEDLTLNILTLDDDWLQQPIVSIQWNQLTNVAEHCLKNLEKKHKEKTSELYLEIKHEHIDQNIKITETALAHEVNISETVIKMQNEIHEAQYIVSLLISAKKAIDDRRRSLDGLTNLYTSNYFQNQTDAPALKDLGDAKFDEQQHEAFNKRTR